MQQWHRIERWRQRVEQHRDDHAQFPEALLYLDDVLALLQAIWHLKDWLAIDPTVGISQVQADVLAHSTPALRTVSDAATAAQRLLLSSIRGDPDAAGYRPRHATGMGRRHAGVEGGNQAGWVIGDSHADALDVAERAIASWREILIERGLLSP